MTKELTDTLMALIEAIIITGAQAPYLYPTPEGGIQAEWSVLKPKKKISISVDANGVITATCILVEIDNGFACSVSAETEKLVKIMQAYEVPREL